MRKIRTRAFSILLTCAMLLSLLPVTALAAEPGTEQTALVTPGPEQESTGDPAGPRQEPSPPVQEDAVPQTEEDTKGTKAKPYSREEFSQMTREQYIAAQERLKGTMYVKIDDYTYEKDGVLGNGTASNSDKGPNKLNYYGAPGAKGGDHSDGAVGKRVVFLGGTITSEVTGYTNIDQIGTSLLLAVPAYTDVTFQGTTFNNVMRFNYQLYTSPWSQLGELKFDGCTFNGIIVGATAAQTLTFDGCEFKDFTNTTDVNNSNPIWIRPAYGNWNAGDNEGQGADFRSLTAINFTNNEVTSTRPVKFEYISRWDITSTVTATGNYFDIRPQAEDKETKNVGLYLGAHKDDNEFNLIVENNSKSDATAALYTIPANKTSLPAGSTVKDSKGNEITITDALVWKTDNKVELKTEYQDSAVAGINGVSYDSLGEAIKAAGEGDTIQVLKDIPDATGMSVPSGKNFTIDFGGHTYTLTGPGAGSTGTETNGFQLLKDSTITMKNGIVRIAEGADNIKRIIQNYADLTLENMQIHAKNQVGGENNALSFNNGNITFKGNTSVYTTSDDTVAFDVYYWAASYPDGTSVTFAPDYTGTINGVILYDSTDHTKGTLTIQGNGTFGNIEASNGNEEPAKQGISIYGGTILNPVPQEYIVPGMEQDETGKVVIDTDTAVAEINGVGYISLTAALNAASDGQTIKLLADSTDNTKVTIQDGRHLTLNMNGFDAGFVQNENISIYHGGLDIIGSGKLYEEKPNYAPVMLYGSDDRQASDYTTITVGKNVTLEGWSGLFINQLKSNSDGVNAFGIKATVNGTLNSVKDITGAGGHALYVNGTIQATEGNVPEIILDGATLNTDLGNGMYLAGYTKTTITDSTITSVGTDSTGIEIRAGELTINGNTVVSGGNGTPGAVSNGNGSTSFNVALAVVQHNTKLPLVVTVNGGTFNGGAALFEKNTQNSTEVELKKVQISVKDGTFKGEVYSEDKADFISGGHFSESVDEQYLDNRLNAELKSASNPEAPYSYYTSMSDAIAAAKPGDVVTPIQTGSTATTYTVTLNYNDGRTGNVTCTVEENASISLPRPTRSGYNFLGWYAGNTKVSSSYQVTGNVTLVAQWSYIDQGGSSGSGSGSSTPTYQVSVDKAEGGKITVSPTRAEKGETVTITVKPDEGYELGKLTVTDKDGDKITLTQKDDNKYTFKMPAGKVTVKATFTEIVVEPEQPELPFSDVAEQDWFYDAVVYVYENELMNGTSATTFSPSVTTSRAMMLTMLARYDGVDTSTGSTWYEAGAAWAVAEGVSDGTNLEADLTREQLVTMLWRYAGSPMVEKDLPDYPDRDEVSDWAVRAMVWAVDNGIITGNGAGELNPQGSASRAEVATILMRFIQL